MGTQGEVEAKIAAAVIKFYVALFSRGAKQIQVCMAPRAVLVVTQNSFSSAEKQMLTSDVAGHESGRMFKDMRSRIMTLHRQQLCAIIETNTGTGVREMHHDISTTTGEEAFVFSLNGQPEYRLKRSNTKAIVQPAEARNLSGFSR
jgi:uncharacterized protein YbcI